MLQCCNEIWSACHKTYKGLGNNFEKCSGWFGKVLGKVKIENWFGGGHIWKEVLYVGSIKENLFW